TSFLRANARLSKGARLIESNVTGDHDLGIAERRHVKIAGVFREGKLTHADAAGLKRVGEVDRYLTRTWKGLGGNTRGGHNSGGRVKARRRVRAIYDYGARDEANEMPPRATIRIHCQRDGKIGSQSHVGGCHRGIDEQPGAATAHFYGALGPTGLS